jgi:hypothetical protein
VYRMGARPVYRSRANGWELLYMCDKQNVSPGSIHVDGTCPVVYQLRSLFSSVCLSSAASVGCVCV